MRQPLKKIAKKKKKPYINKELYSNGRSPRANAK